jgi:hypothetical protein
VNKKEISEYFSQMGKKGAKTCSKALTPEQRSEIAKKAAAARWKDKPAAKNAAGKARG